MPIALVFLTLVLGTIAGLELTTYPKNDSIQRTVGGYTGATSSLVNEYNVSYDGKDQVDENRTTARIADTAVVRVCRQLSYEMKQAYDLGASACSTYNDSTVLYSFIGSAGTTGTLDSVYSQGQNTTLSCSSPGLYGRYIFTRAIPQSMGSGKNIHFNLNAITAGKSDPCGFKEIMY